MNFAVRVLDGTQHLDSGLKAKHRNWLAMLNFSETSAAVESFLMSEPSAQGR